MTAFLSIKKILFLLLTVVSSVSLASCDDDDDSPSVSYEFKLGAEEVNFKQGGDSKEINVRCATLPTVSTDASWVTVSTVDATGIRGNLYKFSLTADANNSVEPRTAEVTVKSGAESATISVIQSGTGLKVIEENLSGMEFPMTGGEATVKFTSGIDYTVTPSGDWISYTSEKDGDTMTLSVNVSMNEGEAREGTLVIAAGSTSVSIPVRQAAYVAQTGSMESNAMQLASKMFAGINIGNTMETPDREGSWNCPVVNRNYIRGLKALGFNAVRVPCAWDSHVIDASTNTIDPAWLSRVNEVVSWIVAEDMYCIVNIHWDGGWLENHINEGYVEEIDKKQHDYWTQIATKLNDYDEHLLFAGMNEPGMNGGMGAGLDAMMRYQQTFVDAVRATGGNNALRVLISQGPSTNIDLTVAGSYHLPTDVVADRQMLEIHMYDPSDFTIMEKGTKEGNPDGWADYAKYYWGSGNMISGSVRNCTWADEAYIDNQLKKMYDSFVSKGIPVIMGEYAAMDRSASSADIDYDRFKASRAAWNKFLTSTAKNYGLVPFYWETSGDINRLDGSALNPYAIDALMEGARSGKYPY